MRPKISTSIRSYLTNSGTFGGKYQKFVYNQKKADFRQACASQYYKDHKIREAGSRTSIRLQAAALLFNGKMPTNSDFIRSSQYLQSELPVRIAHRIKEFHYLPFIAVTNPSILRVMELYQKSFYRVSEFNNGKKIINTDEGEEFSFILETFLDDHSNVIEDLSNGFREAHPHIVDAQDGDEDAAHELVKRFLDKNLTSRLAGRLLVQHHLLLRDQVNRGSFSRDRIGIIEKKWRPADEIIGIGEKISQEWSQFCEAPPKIKLNGHTEAQFPYIPMGINYILQEILKNSFRAVIESPHAARSPQLPSIDCTIAVNTSDFTIRIADRGKGIPPSALDKIWNYHFTTSRGKESNSNMPNLNPNFDEKGLAGYGIGLPVSKAYAEYMGGSLEIKSMDGIGSGMFKTKTQSRLGNVIFDRMVMIYADTLRYQ